MTLRVISILRSETMANKSTIRTALIKAITITVQENREVDELLNKLTGIIMDQALKLRSNQDDSTWHDAMHCAVYNDITSGVESAVHGIVENWDIIAEDE